MAISATTRKSVVTEAATSQKERFGRDCTGCSVRAHCLAAGVDHAYFDEFEDTRLDLRVLRKGDHLFRTGDTFEALYIVRSGAVKTTVVSQDGDEQVTGFYLPGEIVGLDGIESGQYCSNASVLESSSVCLYGFDKLMDLAQTSAGLQRQLWQLASREITTRQRMLMTMGHRSAEARMAEFLLGLSGRFKQIGYSASNFHLPMSRQDIADYLGLSVETVCRVLTRFQKQGMIERAQREISLINFETLLGISMNASGAYHNQRRNEADSIRPSSQPRAGSYASVAG